MAKRSAEVQITKDNCNNEEKVQSGTWSCASKEQIAKRKMVKVRRKSSNKSSSTGQHQSQNKYPTFNLTNTAPKPKQESENAFAKLIPANTWECQVCLVRNKNEQKKCGACETPNPNSSSASKDSEAKDKTNDVNSGGIFTFGSTDNNSKPIESSPPVFTFGSTVSSESTTAPATGFNFSSSNPFAFDTKASSTESLSWGEGTSNFAWGNVAPSSTGNGTESTENSSGLFQFTTQHSLSKPTEPSSEKAVFQQEKEQKSGEEKDRLLYKVHAKVYTLKQVPITKPTEIGEEKKDDEPPKMKEKYVESGSGSLHINVIEEKGNTRARMVLRVDKTQRLVLNSPIFPKMLYSIEGDKYVRYTSQDLDGKQAIFLLKFRNKTETTEVHSYIGQCISMIKEDQTENKTNEKADNETTNGKADNEKTNEKEDKEKTNENADKEKTNEKADKEKTNEKEDKAGDEEEDEEESQV